MNTYRKKLIEVALPIEAINAASAREKTIRHGHPSTLHLWWARRPLATARAILFAQLVDDPSSSPERFPTEVAQDQERQRLFRLIEQLVQWENSANTQVISEARLEIARNHARYAEGPKAQAILSEGVRPEVVNDYLATKLPPVHDPFAGGGTIPLEAQRLGLRTIASDLNPVAVMISKALTEIPPTFAGLPPANTKPQANHNLGAWTAARGLAADVRRYGEWIREEAKRRIGTLYPEIELPKEYGGGFASVVAWLWARTVASPDPAHRGAHVPLVSSFWLSRKTSNKVWLAPVVKRAGSTWRFEIRTGEPPHPERLDLGTKAGKAQDFVCLLSGTPIPRDYIRDEGKAGRLGQRLLAIVAEGSHNRVYVPATPEHENLAASAEEADAVREARETLLSGTTPTRAMITGGVCSAYGLTTFGHLFTARQLVALTTFSDLVEVARELVQKEAKTYWAGTNAASLADSYANAVAVYLSFAVSKATTRNCNLALWEPGMGRLAGALGRQALPMVWSFAETNPLAGAGGDIAGTANSVAEVIEALPIGPGGEALQADAKEASRREVSIVSTDPPYYDNISYAELSDFFYPWLRRTLRPIFPQLFSTVLVPKADELIAAPHRTGSRELAEAFFLQGIRAALERIARDSVPNEPITVYYAFKQSEQSGMGTSSTGWETFLDGLIGSGLQVTATWPIRTELTSALKKDIAVLASSIVLTCRPAKYTTALVTRSDLRRALRKELPDALKKLQQGSIAPVDLAQASIGPGMAIFSRNKQVLEADGSIMTVRAALQLINEVLDEYLASGEGDFDADTRFAITWYEQHGWEPGTFGEAETLAKARNISVVGVVEAGICHSAAGKVRILKRSEMRPLDYDPATDDRPTIWEFTQHMIRILDEEGEEEAARLLKKLGSAADATRELAYRLYNTCERKKWAEDARSYNALILAWPELEKLARKLGDEPPPAPPSKHSKKVSKKTKSPKKKAQQELFEEGEE